MFLEALIQGLRELYFALLATAPLAALFIWIVIQFLTGDFGVWL